jgi:4-carboxymuconolactone decarboxylase
MGCHISNSVLAVNGASANVVVGGVRAAIPRLAPIPFANLPPQVKAALDILPADSFKNKYAPLNVFGTIAQSDQIAPSFLSHWAVTKSLSSLSNREQEIIILRMGFHYRSDYVWKHHCIIAAEFGVTEKELIELQQLPCSLSSTFSDREYHLIAITDEFNKIKTISSELWNESSKYIKEQEYIDIILIVAHYVFFSLVNNSFCVDLEQSFDSLPGLSSDSTFTTIA